MNVTIIDEGNYLNEQESDLLRNILTEAGKALKLPEDAEVDVSIVSNEAIHALNQQYRQVDRPTDVLSFPLEEGEDELDLAFGDLLKVLNMPRHLGDIVISYPRMQEQAEEYGHSQARELAFLAVHGFLHLNGYDHQTPQEEAEMFGIQEKVLDNYGLSR
ncbi:rRNA maturation RNase YbeY [Suicoccus acidiformans]|uniref:Endoribonuclease YbeY n=1 Tax=Suicoccus acidiformans TaxID=2036206 RepID=A0A347WLG4_9LACT|nr:rRNA maturation RNase YbeY [Suicoccus acidiformans]AXY25921.1 rRNA maturation RNase YbeY [Suicoccus acidiformans]